MILAYLITKGRERRIVWDVDDDDQHLSSPSDRPLLALATNTAVHETTRDLPVDIEGSQSPELKIFGDSDHEFTPRDLDKAPLPAFDIKTHREEIKWLEASPTTTPAPFPQQRRAASE